MAAKKTTKPKPKRSKAAPSFAQMRIISIVSNKGGVGKTTLTVNLAAAAEIAGLKTAIIDLDPQSSAELWKDVRGEKGPAVYGVKWGRLKEAVKAAEADGYDLVFIDTPPKIEDAITPAAKLADFCLIPVVPSAPDLQAIGATMALFDRFNVQAVVVLNACPNSEGLKAGARAVVRKAYDFPLCPVEIGRRVDFVHAHAEGKGVVEFAPAGKAADEIVSLFEWTLQALAALDKGRTLAKEAA
jgi:chromosome partitioning protein